MADYDGPVFTIVPAAILPPGYEVTNHEAPWWSPMPAFSVAIGFGGGGGNPSDQDINGYGYSHSG